ncbi:MAG: UvrD-helicase domain-containing protein [Clostridiales bacterium]|nr:UvrD-helicase domain-containing protein [Clostridiales bacterium]
MNYNSAEKVLSDRFASAVRRLFDEKIYDSLNERQREAVYAVNGPLLVLAGAGSGKTTVLVSRISHIIRFGDLYESPQRAVSRLNEEDVAALERAAASDMSRDDAASLLEACAVEPCPPWAVLAITFTNKAANEMKNRLADTTGDKADEIWAGTFHSVAVRILRRFGERIGYRPGFTIYDTDDTKRLMTQVMKDLNIDEKNFPVRSVMTTISRAKDRLLTPDGFEQEAGKDFKLSQTARIYREYQRRMKDSNVLDFDDLIMQTVYLLRTDEDARSYYQRRFKYVSVDEYQDTNRAQFEMIRLLSDFHRNLMVVGDDDQSIYKFRGATIENILNFDKELEDVRVVKLEQNYRSTQNILDAANAVISNNTTRHGKKLWTGNGAGELIRVKKVDTQGEEGKYIANRVLELKSKDGMKYSNFAVLYRVNAQSNSIEHALSASGVPYRVLGGLRFYERKEIKDILAYLCVINNTSDDLRLRRIVNEPKRKIGDATIQAVESIARAEGVSMFDVMSRSDRYTAISKTSAKLKEFVSLIETLRERSKTEELHRLVELAIDMTGYRDMLLNSGDDAIDRLQNISELVSNAVEFEQTHDLNAPPADGDADERDESAQRSHDGELQSFLEEISLVTDIDNYDSAADAVTLMTIHSAKGLEFPVVFLPGMEEGIFPGNQASMYPEELEEERRLAYVAITRAKTRLFIIHARERMIYGRSQYNQESRFIKELPEECVETDQDRTQAQPQNRGRRRPMMSREMKSTPDLVRSAPERRDYERFEVGERVKHATFGDGTILSAKEMGRDMLYEIAFDTVGTKKLMATFARLKKA